MDPTQPPLTDWTKAFLSLSLGVFRPVQWAWWPFTQLVPVCQLIFCTGQFKAALSTLDVSSVSLATCLLTTRSEPQGFFPSRSFCAELFSLHLPPSNTAVIPPSSQDSAVVLMELHEVPVGPFSQLLRQFCPLAYLSLSTLQLVATHDLV